MYTVGSWFPILLNLSIIAIAVLAIIFWMLYQKNQYDKQSRGAIWADIWLPSGDSFFKLVKPTVDGYIHILKGVYRLSVSKQYCKCGHDYSQHLMGEEGKDRGKLVCQIPDCPCKEYELEKVIPNVRRKAKYPPRPFLGLRWLQNDVRTESWYLNNPDPITWADSRSAVTALDAYVHTRQMAGEQNAASIAESDARQKKWEQIIEKVPDKMTLYILLGLAILAGIVSFIHGLISKAG